MKKYKYTFEFFNTIEQAKKEKTNILKNANSYYKKTYKNKFFINNWTSTDQTEHKIIMSYYY